MKTLSAALLATALFLAPMAASAQVNHGHGAAPVGARGIGAVGPRGGHGGPGGYRGGDHGGYSDHGGYGDHGGYRYGGYGYGYGRGDWGGFGLGLAFGAAWAYPYYGDDYYYGHYGYYSYPVAYDDYEYDYSLVDPDEARGAPPPYSTSAAPAAAPAAVCGQWIWHADAGQYQWVSSSCASSGQ